MFNILILSNSPGELSSWVSPLVHTVAQTEPMTRIHIYLLPCQYASGNEQSIAQSLPNVDLVKTPKQTLLALFSRSSPQTPQFNAVLSLGGDPMYARLFSKKYGCQNYVYTEKRFIKLKNSTILYKHEVGDLMADKVQMATQSRSKILARYGLSDRPYLLFFPGSRPPHFQAFFPIICDTIHLLRKKDPKYTSIVNIPPFITETMLRDAQKKCQTEGIIFLRANSIEMLIIAELLISLPGTNTAEAMYAGTPMLVVTPLNKPDLIIFDGLFGLVVKIPLLGYLLRRLVLVYLKKKTKFLSAPNQKAKKTIVSEMIGNITAISLTNKIIQTVNDKKGLEIMRHQLLAMNHSSQASLSISKIIHGR